MELFPAIDLKDGNVVRLFQGDYDRMTVYGSDPAEMARRFAKAGARCLHIVDLDGAKDGGLPNSDSIKKILAAGDFFTEVGGGIRSMAAIRRYLELGADRVILGTAAVDDPDFLAEAIKTHGEKIAVGVDAKDGFVAVRGWKEVTDVESVPFCEKLRGMGVKTVIYTDIAKDGALSGTNLDVYRRLSEITGLSITASGGISSLSELVKLEEMGVAAAILGKALYDGKLDLKRAITELKGGGNDH